MNEEVKKEAEFFGDIVIVPYKDTYDLVVLKTVAICEYGVSIGSRIERFTTLFLHKLTKYRFFQVRTVSARHIMKGDDDTFVRVDAVIEAATAIKDGRSLYVGNMNYFHEPLRSGKWTVTYEVIRQSCFFSFLESVSGLFLLVMVLYSILYINSAFVKIVRSELPEKCYVPVGCGILRISSKPIGFFEKFFFEMKIDVLRYLEPVNETSNVHCSNAAGLVQVSEMQSLF